MGHQFKSKLSDNIDISSTNNLKIKKNRTGKAQSFAPWILDILTFLISREDQGGLGSILLKIRVPNHH
jgi:hypothetical protein